jgi:hypothetical protein
MSNARIEALAYVMFSQGGWLVCVLSAARGKGWVGTLIVAMLAVAHVYRARAPLREALLVAIISSGGWLWECLPTALGYLRYPSGTIVSGGAPYWIAGLWALFALQINVLFTWLRDRALLAGILGGLFGPLSFRAGSALGAVQFVEPVAAVALLGCGWAVLLPTAVWLGKKLDGVEVA